MEAVAAGDEVADQLALDARHAIAEPRAIALDVVDRDVGRLPDDRAVAGEARGDQVPRHLGLAIDGDGLARQLAEVDAQAPAAGGDLDAVMHQPVAMQPLGDAGLFQQADRALLQHAGANARLDIVARPGFQDHAVDAVQLQQAGEQEPCRPGADDADLSPFLRCHRRASPRRHARRDLFGAKTKLAYVRSPAWRSSGITALSKYLSSSL